MSDHPYYSDVDEDDFKLSKDQLLTHFSERLNFSDAVIFVSGFVKKKLIQSLDRVFGKIELKKLVKPEILRVDSSLAHKSLIRKDDALQSGIRIGRLIPIQRSSVDYVPFAVLNTVLGGYFSSRLMSNIREDKGYTYGIGSGLISNLASTIFLISTEVNAEYTEDTIREIKSEINRLQNEKISDMELQRVKNYMVGAFLKKSDGPFNVCDQFKSCFLHGLDLSYNDNYLHEIQEVNSENVRDLAGKFLNFEDLIQVVAGKL
jgi:predicted Zn-dependent peptidase